MLEFDASNKILTSPLFLFLICEFTVRFLRNSLFVHIYLLKCSKEFESEEKE